MGLINRTLPIPCISQTKLTKILPYFTIPYNTCNQKMAAIAVRVFGTPITNGTRTQRALAAKNNQNTDGKLDQVLQVSNQSQKVGIAATGSTTFGRIYNATGQTVTYVTTHDWEGNISGPYPVEIQNGQWAVFEHVDNRRTNRKGSVAAVVYNIEDCCDFMISWNNPWKTSGENKNTVSLTTIKSGLYDP